MASSSICLFFISMAVLSQILFIPSSALTSTEYIGALCQNVNDNTFCMQTLSAYPPAVSATDLYSLATIVINLGIVHANNTGDFAAETAKNEPTLKAQFKSCQHEYDSIQMYLDMARGELNNTPMGANYDIFRCTDITMRVKDLVGGNRDNASKTLMERTLRMDKLLDLALGGTRALGG